MKRPLFLYQLQLVVLMELLNFFSQSPLHASNFRHPYGSEKLGSLFIPYLSTGCCMVLLTLEIRLADLE